MLRSYEYGGYTVELVVEADFRVGSDKHLQTKPGYIAIVRIFRSGSPIATFSPLRFVDTRGRPFKTEADALLGGYSAARNIVDDLFSVREGIG